MIDIIVPVYDAFEDLQKCVNSVIQHTDLSQNRLIFVNDCSPDRRIAPYLDSLASENILVHHNEKNKGFSANVNYGISCSEENDVLLLNTDTIVTRGWLEKIAVCANRDAHIASVTPLSNRAEICSVPGYLEKNDIPKGYTVDSFADLVERCSLHLYPQITVAIGFCMYIKRETIRKVGLFDADTFERGYGEENDFCSRATLLGYYHVMCDDTFVYHTGCASFREARNELCLQHEQILRQRYPDLMHQNDVYVRDNPNMLVSENIKLHMALDSGRKNILLVSHRDFRKGALDNIGGIQLHIADLVKNLRKQFNVIVAARDGVNLAVTVYGSNFDYTLWYYIGEQPRTPMLYNANFKKIFREIMENFSIALVHIQHVHGISLEPFEVAHELNIPLVCTLHDFYYLCPTVKCLCPDGKFCEISSCKSTCRECLEDNTDIGFDSTIVPDYIATWREACARALSYCEWIVAPSANEKKYYTKIYPTLADKIVVISHGNDFSSRRKTTNILKRRPHIAFVGGLSFEKGSQIALEMIQNALDIRWYVIGNIGDSQLAEYESKNLKKLGPYRRENLAELLRRHTIDLVCIPSVWAETFCYTVSEATSYGIPVLCFDLGAQGERVNATGAGWTVPLAGGAAAMIKKIRELQRNPEKYKDAVQACINVKNYSTEEMSQKYIERYENVISENQVTKKVEIKNLLQQQGQNAAGIGASSARVEELTAKLYEIETAPSYQIMLRARKNLPFKKQLKRLLWGK